MMAIKCFPHELITSTARPSARLATLEDSDLPLGIHSLAPLRDVRLAEQTCGCPGLASPQQKGPRKKRKREAPVCSDGRCPVLASLHVISYFPFPKPIVWIWEGAGKSALGWSPVNGLNARSKSARPMSTRSPLSLLCRCLGLLTTVRFTA